MIDQSRITSGFDLELLLSERYIKYFLLSSFETGSMPWYMQDIDPDTGDITHIMIHPPVELQENRLYIPLDFVAHPFPDEVPVVYTNLATACEVQLLPDDQEADVRVTLIISIIAPPFLPGGDPVILTEQDMTMDAKFFLLADPAPNGHRLDWLAFADAWRDQYQPGMEEVRAGRIPFSKLDVLHRRNLDRILPGFGIASLPEEAAHELNLAWHRLDGWPDVAPGLARLRQRGRLAPVSNGNISLMVDVARRNNFPWDAILGAEVAGDYKPKPRVYLAACEALDLLPADCMMVAAAFNVGS